MMRVVLLVFWFLLPSLAGAQTVAVRSGEHDDFTRLVFMFGGKTKWSLEERPGGIDVEFPAFDGRFGLSDVFRYIPKSRITDIVFDAGSRRIQIELSENVKAEGFELSSGPVVIDFKLSDNVKPSPRIEKSETTVDPSVLSNLWRRNFQVSREPASDRALNNYGQTILSAPNTDKIEDDLYRQISRAASQGLLKLDLEKPPAEHEAVKLPAPQSNVSANETSSVGMVSNTAIDREVPPAEEGWGSRKAEMGCIPAAKFALESFEIEEEHVTSMLSAARRNLVEELDRDNRTAAKDMAYAYITLGFGYEAAEVADSFDLSAYDKLAIGLMAAVVDQHENDLPSTAKGCDGSSLMWEFLAGTAEPSQPAMRTKILDSFVKLPHRLRSLLGDRLVQKFIEAGYADAAKTVQSNFVNLPQSRDFGAEMARARLAHADDDTDLAHDILEQEAQKNNQSSIEALAMLIDTASANGAAVEHKLIAQIDALLFELGETDDAVALVRAKALAQGLNGQYSEAMKTLSSWPSESVAGYLAATKEDILSQAVRNADEYQFSKLYFENAGYVDKTPHHPDLALGLAKKLFASGFPEQARGVLNKNFRNEPRARELLAEISLQEGDAPAALSYLTGVMSERAEEIRKIAKFTLGSPEIAAADIPDEAFADTRLIGLWQHGRWAEIEEGGTDAERDFLQKFEVLKDAVADDAEPSFMQPLAEAGALLTQSAEERKAFEALMQEAVPDI